MTIRITIRSPKPIVESANTITVYHGGKWDGRTPIKTNGRGALGIGAYFSPDTNVAAEYAQDSGLNYIVSCELNLANPLAIEEAGHPHPAVQALIQLEVPELQAVRLINAAEERKGYPGAEISSRAIAAGYDGLIRKYNGQVREIVIWRPAAVLHPKKLSLDDSVLTENLDGFTPIRDEYELDELEVSPHPYDLANSVGIRISRASEFAFGLAKDGRLAGALFTEIDDGVMMFDIVVDPNFRRLGIADKFVRYAVTLFRGYESDGLVESLSANVVNPAMIGILKKYGFVTLQQLPDREIMMFQPQHN